MKTILAIASLVAMLAIPAALAAPNEAAMEHNPIMAINEMESQVPMFSGITDLPGFSNAAAPGVLDYFAELYFDETTPGFSGAQDALVIIGAGSIGDAEPAVPEFTPAADALDNAPGQNKEPE